MASRDDPSRPPRPPRPPARNRYEYEYVEDEDESQSNQQGHRDFAFSDAFWRNISTPDWGPPGNPSGQFSNSQGLANVSGIRDERSRSRHRSETVTSQGSTQDLISRTNNRASLGSLGNHNTRETVGSRRISNTNNSGNVGGLRSSGFSEIVDLHPPRRESVSTDRGRATNGSSGPIRTSTQDTDQQPAVSGGARLPFMQEERTSNFRSPFQSTNDGSRNRRVDKPSSHVFQEGLHELENFNPNLMLRQDMNRRRRTNEEAYSHRRSIIQHTPNNSPFVNRKDFSDFGNHRDSFPDGVSPTFGSTDGQNQTFRLGRGQDSRNPHSEEAFFNQIRQLQGPSTNRRGTVIQKITVPRKAEKLDPFMWLVVKESFFNHSTKKVEVLPRRAPKVVKITKSLNLTEADQQVHTTFKVTESVKFFVEHVDGSDIFLDNVIKIRKKCEESAMFFGTITIEDVAESSIFIKKVVAGYTHKPHLLIKRVDANADDSAEDSIGRLRPGKPVLREFDSSSGDENYQPPSSTANEVLYSSSDDGGGGKSQQLSPQMDFGSSEHEDLAKELNLRPGGASEVYKEQPSVKVEEALEEKVEEDDAPFRFHSSPTQDVEEKNSSFEYLPDPSGPSLEYESVKVNGKYGPDGHRCSIQHVIKEILPNTSGGLVIEIDRSDILGSALLQYQKLEKEKKLLEKFEIAFKQELAVDGGGPSREFIRLLIKEARAINILGGDRKNGLTFQPRFAAAKTIEAVSFFLFNQNLITAVEPTFPPVLLAILFEKNLPDTPALWHQLFEDYPSNGGTDLDINLNMLNDLGVIEMEKNHPNNYASLLCECDLAIGKSVLCPEEKTEIIGRMFHYEMNFKNVALWGLVKAGIQKSGYKELAYHHPSAPAVYSLELVPFLVTTAQGILSKMEFRSTSQDDAEDCKKSKEQLRRALQLLEDGDGVLFNNQVSEVRLGLKEFCVFVTAGSNLVCVDEIDVDFTRLEAKYFHTATCNAYFCIPLNIEEDQLFQNLLFEKMSFPEFTSY